MKLSQSHKAPLVAALFLLAVAVGSSGCTRKPKDPAAGGPDPMAGPPMDAPVMVGPAPQDMRPRPMTRPTDMAPRPVSTAHKPTPAVKAPDADQKAVVDAANQLALDLYARLQSKKGNLFLSPWSISTALGMTYAGAQGPTATQMSKVLHFRLPHKRLHPAIAAVQHRLTAGKGYELSIANRVFSQTGMALRPAYAALLKDVYGAPLQLLDFKAKPQPSRKVINAWVSQRTQKRIEELLKERDIDKDSRMVLVNAIYFKGSWASRFKKENTQKADFHVTAAKRVKVHMMHQQQKFGYRATPEADVLEMGYQGKRLSMVVVLPKRVDGLAALEKGLTAQKLAALTSKLNKRKVKVYLPRFKLASRFDLKAQLSAMGMPVAFSDAADFRGMEPKRLLKISKVIHQANCDVTEEGTVAAAATAVVMKLRGAARPPAIPVFRADHPFLFAIRDTQTGVILFLGRFVAP